MNTRINEVALHRPTLTQPVMFALGHRPFGSHVQDSASTNAQ